MNLGAPNQGEREYYSQEEHEGITVWYARNICPEKEGEPILISARKAFLTMDLEVHGARQQVAIE